MISIMVEALTNPARLLDRFGISGAPGDGVRKILGRANSLAVAIGRSPSERVGVVRALVEKVVVDEKMIIVKVRPDALLNRDIPITRIGGPKRQYY